LLVGSVAANDDEEEREIQAPTLEGAEIEAPPTPVSTTSAGVESSKGVPMYRIPRAGRLPASDFGTFYEQKEDKWVPKQGVKFDPETRTWTDTDGNQYRYAEEGEGKVVVTGGSLDQIGIWDSKEKSYDETYVTAGVVENIDPNGLTKIEDGTFYYGENVRRQYSETGYTEETNIAAPGENPSFGITKEYKVEKVGGQKMAFTTTYRDEDPVKSGYQKTESTLRVSKAGSRTNMEANFNSGEITVTHEDGSTDTFRGRRDSITYDSSKPYMIRHNTEIYNNPREIYLNPDGSKFVKEEIDNDIRVYNSKGDLVGESPTQSGYIEDELSPGQNIDQYIAESGFGGDFVGFEEPNGGIDKFVIDPNIESDEDGSRLVGSYYVNLGRNSPKIDGKQYYKGQGGFYYGVDEEGNPETLSREEQARVQETVEGRGPTVKKDVTVDPDTGELTDDGDEVNDDKVKNKLVAQADAQSTTADFFAGRTKWARIGQWLSFVRPQRQAISNALFGKAWLNEWRETVDRAFAENYLGVDYWVSDICQKKVRHTQRQGNALISTPDIDQFIGHVEATKSEPVPVLCNTNNYCRQKTDDVTAECEGNICLINGEEAAERFYKITFHVAAPSDVDLTYYKSEDDMITFNILLIGDEKSSNLFNKFIALDAGQVSDQIDGVFSPVMDYAPYDYETICIVFGKKPLSVSGGPSDQIDKICNTVKTTEQSINNVLTSQSEGAVGGSSAQMNPGWSGG